MDYLDNLEQRSLYIIREAYSRYRNCALLWSTGKDSTAMLWIARKAFLGKIPFPVIHIDTTYNSKEVYTFREMYEKEWGLNLIIAQNKMAIEKGMGPECNEKSECCEALKTIALKKTLEENSCNVLLAGIRGDEHEVLVREKGISRQCMDIFPDTRNMQATILDMYQSEIKTDNRLRIHPMIFWTVTDIWHYIKREKIPVLSRYFAHSGKRYKNIGCEPCCTPVDSTATTVKKIIKEHEDIRAAGKNGKTAEPEDAYTIQKLKSLGYM
ncbi:MAG: sulfate adenylyltransferase subunit CysD [Spirochaetales bacterium]|nr:sulfate adenylyltransferase subunit CysD [Spirochaetales bacterium]